MPFYCMLQPFENESLSADQDCNKYYENYCPLKDIRRGSLSGANDPNFFYNSLISNQTQKIRAIFVGTRGTGKTHFRLAVTSLLKRDESKVVPISVTIQRGVSEQDSQLSFKETSHNKFQSELERVIGIAINREIPSYNFDNIRFVKPYHSLKKSLIDYIEDALKENPQLPRFLIMIDDIDNAILYDLRDNKLTEDQRERIILNLESLYEYVSNFNTKLSGRAYMMIFVRSELDYLISIYGKHHLVHDDNRCRIPPIFSISYNADILYQYISLFKEEDWQEVVDEKCKKCDKVIQGDFTLNGFEKESCKQKIINFIGYNKLLFPRDYIYFCKHFYINCIDEKRQNQTKSILNKTKKECIGFMESTYFDCLPLFCNISISKVTELLKSIVPLGLQNSDTEWIEALHLKLRESPEECKRLFEYFRECKLIEPIDRDSKYYRFARYYKYLYSNEVK